MVSTYSQPNRWKRSRGAALTTLALAFSSLPVRAQAPSIASSDPASTGPITKLEQMTVSDVPLTDQVLPTVRPIDSVYGDGMSIIDTPRAVSSVNKAWMDDRMIKNAMDFGQFSPGVYSAADYGIPGVPQIRGDLGQVYVNGQLSLFSRNSTPLSFNGVEAMDVVKGPGTAVYGPRRRLSTSAVRSATSSPFGSAICRAMAMSIILTPKTKRRTSTPPSLTGCRKPPASISGRRCTPIAPMKIPASTA